MANTFTKWLESEESQKLEVVDIPEYTEELEAEQNKLKADKFDWWQIAQDRLDYLEFLETANKFKVSDTKYALKCYKRAEFERLIGKWTNIKSNIK